MINIKNKNFRVPAMFNLPVLSV